MPTKITERDPAVTVVEDGMLFNFDATQATIPKDAGT
jgi:hypothetical protein